MMRESLTRILGRLRSATQGSATAAKLHEETAIRGGQPQRIEALPAPARVRS